jgi:hypothetical protein
LQEALSANPAIDTELKNEGSRVLQSINYKPSTQQ